MRAEAKMENDRETEPVPVHVNGGAAAPVNPKRAWTIKGIRQDTVNESRKAAQMNGMLVSLWVEKQLKDAADRELKKESTKSLGAEVLSSRVENIETMLRQYIIDQDKSITKLQEELHVLSHKIIPPLLQAIASDRVKKRA